MQLGLITDSRGSHPLESVLDTAAQPGADPRPTAGASVHVGDRTGVRSSAELLGSVVIQDSADWAPARI